MIIETERLRLRPPEAFDFDAFFAYRSDPASTRHLGGPLTRDCAWKQLGHIRACWQLLGVSQFSVTLRRGGAWIGLVGPWRLYGWPGEEFRYEIAAAHCRKGYAHEAAAAVLDWLFESEGRTEMRLHVAPDNAASIALAHALGAHGEGPGRPPQPFDGSPCEVFTCRPQDRPWIQRPPKLARRA